MHLHSTVLAYIASEEICSEAEVAEFVRLNGGVPEQAAQMLASWSALGWIESVEPAPGIRLTDRAYVAHPELLRQAT